MRALIVNPMEAPVVREISSSLEDLQKAVGGWVEALYPFDDDAAILCNEEGKLIGLDLNRALRDENGAIYDVIAGTFLVTGLTEDGFGSLSQEQLATYAALFSQPEMFLLDAGTIHAVPIASIGRESIPTNDFEETRKGMRLEIQKDPHPADPRRAGTNFGTMILFDPACKGDPHVYPDKDAFFKDLLTAHFGSVEKAESFLSRVEKSPAFQAAAVSARERNTRIVRELQKDHVLLPVFRSGKNAISAMPDADSASRRIGWIYADKKAMEQRYGEMNGYTIHLAKEALENEVMIYSDYLSGENYTYRLIDDRSGKTLDSGCWTGDLEALKAFAWNSAPKTLTHSMQKENPIR